MDVSTVRACPICRRTCYLVVPSMKTPDSPEEKAAIIQAYKDNLRRIVS